MDYKEVVQKANDLLDKHEDWKDRYGRKVLDSIAKAVEALDEQQKIACSQRAIARVRKPLALYTTFSLVKAAEVVFNLRFQGILVANIVVKEGKKLIRISDALSESNNEHFGIKGFPAEFLWNSPQAEDFRHQLRTAAQKPARGKGKERSFEQDFYKEFSQSNISKKLPCCKPVRLLSAYFQMPTPLGASKISQGILKYSDGRQGGIDALARVGKGKGSNLCVMELKDEYEKPEEVIKQALAYSVFVARLLRGNDGNAWYKAFGYTGDVPKNLEIYACTVMPPQSKKDSLTKMDTLEVCESTCIKMYTLFYNRDKHEFSGSLKEELQKRYGCED